MEEVKRTAKAALEKLFSSTAVSLTSDEIEALKLLLSIRGLLPSLDANDYLVLNNISDETELRQALLDLARLSVDRLFATVYGV